MKARIAIAGAGLLGRLLAWQLSQQGHDVTVFDPAPRPELRTDGKGAAAWTSAGMLSPWAELENGGAEVFKRGVESIALWQKITARLSHSLKRHHSDLYKQNGSLLLNHASDAGSAKRVSAHWQAQLDVTPAASHPQPLNAAALRELEPAIAPHLQGWHLPQEAQVSPHAVLQALHADAPRVQWHWGVQAVAVEPGRLQWQPVSHAHQTGDPSLMQPSHQPPQYRQASSQNHQPQTLKTDWAIDTRGLGACSDLALRGVRGEIITLHAPGIALSRPIRLLHPRHRVYIVPRSGEQIVVGASEIESEDRSPVSLRSAVELMAAAHSVLPELAEARIIHLETNLRPALPDNQAHIHLENGLVRINGLFRHGWLLGPSLVAEALEVVAPN